MSGTGSILMTSNGFTNKELLNMVLDRLDKLDEKIDSKVDKSEFYKVLGLLATVILIVAAFMKGSI
tara:strand:- start:169 stop:366 length:198 start_codon:yes stop_codon:yes gene_type:complete